MAEHENTSRLQDRPLYKPLMSSVTLSEERFEPVIYRMVRQHRKFTRHPTALRMAGF
jgi:hypothetical protein